MPLPVRVIRLRRGDRTRLQRLTRARTTPQRVVERARIVLASAAGDSGHTICAKVGVSRPTVTLWLDRYQSAADDEILLDLCIGRPGRVSPPMGDVIPGDHWSGSTSTFTMSFQVASRLPPALLAARRSGV